MRTHHHRTWNTFLLALCLLSIVVAAPAAVAQRPTGARLWLPLTIGGRGLAHPPASPTPPVTPPSPPDTPVVPPSDARGYPRVHSPHWESAVTWEEASVFWFGRITPSENGVDVRLGSTDDALLVRLSIYDRLLWYAADAPSADALTQWDAATLYLDMNADPAAGIGEGTYRLTAQLRWWEDPAPYQATYRGANGAWQAADLGAVAEAGYRGEGAPNSGAEARGWALTWRIPFAGLGLSSRPADGVRWGLAVAVHDRDAASAPPNPDVVWPRGMVPDAPQTWGTLSFGLPAAPRAEVAASGTVTVRHGLNGAVVPDGHVGGGAVCGDGLDFWTAWGEANYAGAMPVNVQNQDDIADWPCFSRYYITFPLDAVPAGTRIVSATLTLRQMGSSMPGEAVPSLIQAFSVSDDWDEATLTWNNAPPMRENLDRTWVDPIPFPGDWSALPAYSWDVTRAAAEALAAGQPLRLALYSADGAYHSGRHFVPSDTEDWNATNRPTLTVVWGE
jgi:hypothetical protein